MAVRPAAMGAIIETLLDIAALPPESLPRTARRMASLSLFDWMTVLIAGARQDLSAIVRDLVVEEGGRPGASVAGTGIKVPARAAALANGAMSHALDYDDTHFAHIGHLSVAIYPAALAVGEEAGAPAEDVRDAFLLGAEASCRIGLTLGREHYQRGFHQTATAGAFGATIAAGRLYRLERSKMRHALGLVSTRASGLKSQFGSMGKSFNAGIAASNGVETARLALRGFTSCDDGIGGAQGFIETHADAPDLSGPWLDLPPHRFIFDGNSYKLHACCHGTHAMIEALRQLLAQHRLADEDVIRIQVFTHPRWLTVCDLQSPRTGLEAKFSYRLLAAMTLHGIDMSSERAFTDDVCADPRLRRLADRVSVTGDPQLNDTTARVEVVMQNSKVFSSSHDLARPIALGVLEEGLRRKSAGLLGGDRARVLWEAVSSLERQTASSLAALLVSR